MFTGLVESLGQVSASVPMPDGGRDLTIEHPFANELTLGESVAINGACLTVVAFDTRSARFQLGPETLVKTNLGLLTVGQKVNLERSLKVGDRLGGHFVQGHVDATGTIDSRQPDGEWVNIWFRCPASMTRLMVPKGSIAVDGISLTLVHVERERFMVMLIPHTLERTTLGFKQAGDTVNLEADMIAKHVQKLVEPA